MAAKGPRSDFNGINVKSGKMKEELDFSAFMRDVISNEENEQLPPPSPPKRKDLSEEEYKRISQESEEAFASIVRNNEEVTISDIEEIPEEPNCSSFLETTKGEKVEYFPNLPFNQQPRPKNYNQNRTIQKLSEIETEKKLQELNIEKEEISATSKEIEREKVEEINEEVKAAQEGKEEIYEETAPKRTIPSKYNNDEKPSETEEKLSMKEEKSRKKKYKEEAKKARSKSKEKPQKGKKTKDQSSDLEKNSHNIKKTISPEKLAAKHFPKTYYDPVDIEIDRETGEEGYYFNIEKTLRKYNALWITKIIPLRVLDKLTYDKPLFDNYAIQQHNKTVKLNNSSAEDQYVYENRNKMIKFMSLAGVLIAIALFVVLKVIPDSRYDSAIESAKNSQWSTAYQEFKELGTHKNSKFYGKYSEAMTQLKDKKYDEAKKNFELLLDYQDLFPSSIIDMVNECDYQKAISIYSSKDFYEAMKIFATIPKYKESTDYYYKCGYLIASKYEEEGDLKNALDAYYRVRAYRDDNKNATEDVQRLARQMYDTAINYYHSQKYEDALTEFKFLAKYSYKDSKSMISQCQYRNGLNKFNQGDLEGARESLAPILTYKDSNAMYKECTYKIAQQKYAESIESSLAEYGKIPTYRNVPNIMNQNVFVLYGKWTIIEMNGSKTVPVDFKFNSGGLFETDKKVLYTAISTEASHHPYIWDGEKYVTEDGNYTLSATAITNNQIKLVCTQPEKTVEFTCIRKQSYLNMLNTPKDEESNTDIFEDEESTNDIITRILQDYINNKTDGTVILNEKEFNALMIIQGQNTNME